MAGLKKKSYRKPLRRRRAVGGRKGSVSVGVKKYVKRAISSDIENKCVQVNQQISFGSITESPDMNAFPMCPLNSYWVISQGTGQGARLGNRIKIKSVHLNYVLRPNPYGEFNLAPVPCNVLLYLGYVKNAPSYAPTSATDFSQFFQGGNSVYAPAGTLKDGISIINKDWWVIKKRWIEKIGYAFNDGTGAIPGNQYFANNDYKYNVTKRLNITKYCQKTCVFNDAAGGQTNRNLFLMYEAVSSTGFNLGATALPINIDYWIDFVYEDA